MDNANPDPVLDRVCCFKRGMFVVSMPDGNLWGSDECWPNFAVLKFPTIAESALQKYLAPQMDAVERVMPDGSLVPQIYRCRLWKIDWTSLPTDIQNKLGSVNGITVQAGSYSGAYDYTWDQIKAYFLNSETGLFETGIL